MEIKKYINKRLAEGLATNGYANADAIRGAITKHLELLAYGNGEATTDVTEEKIEDLYLRYTQLHDAISKLWGEHKKVVATKEWVEEQIEKHLD